MDFSGKRVLVTGGARGIGRAVAQAFAARGSQVALSYRSNHEAAQETLATLSGGPHVIIPGDIADAEVAAEVVKHAHHDLGGLDIVVNNAGVGGHHPLEAVSYEDWQAAWQRILAVNLLAPANICYCAALYMMEHGGGRIINVSSRGAFRGEPESPAYGASKAGLNAMSQSLAQKLAPYNIFVGVVAPGFVETDMAAARLAGP